MTAACKAAVQFQQVDYSIGDMQILKKITGSFPEERITTIVGPSGSGKSTLLKLCNGLLSPDSGEIYVLDRPIGNFSPLELRRSVGIALQNAPMVKGTVYDNLALPMRLQGVNLREEEAAESLKDVGLEEQLLHRNSADLSGGQQQKVSIARTLMNRPQILLLDEITSSLDRTSQQEVEELIVKINGKYGTAILWVTHNLEQAMRIGDCTWVMMNGEVAETGESSLLAAPATAPVRQFVKGDVQ